MGERLLNARMISLVGSLISSLPLSLDRNGVYVRKKGAETTTATKKKKG